MVDVKLTIYSLEGAREIPLTGRRASIGRDDAADLSIDDDGLSRLHATIYREGDRVWILDESSTNGTYVNGGLVPPSGVPLVNGDEITIGNGTTILVNIRQAVTVAEVAQGTATTPAENSWYLPLIAAVAVVVVILGAVVLGSHAYRKRTSDDGAQGLWQNRNAWSVNREPLNQSTSNSNSSLFPGPSPSSASSLATETDSELSATEQANKAGTPLKRYASMTKEEQFNFVAREAQRVARMIGNREGLAHSPEVVKQIKIWVDGYAGRLKLPPPSGGCRMLHHDLRTLLTRASQHAPGITKAFNEKGLPAQVGLYLAMIESEYCPCLSSGTGAKGMFQFVGTTARKYGVKDVSQPSTDPRPDDRCKVDVMAPIAAQYVKDLVAIYGTGPLSVPLAIASYNSGEGGLSRNLFKTLDSVKGSERSFWSLVADADQLSSQFQRENIRYVPHFFGAAIVGENPRVFGVDTEPLSFNTVSTSTAAPNPK